MGKQKSKDSLEQLATIVAAVQGELKARGIGFIVIHAGNDVASNRLIGVFGSDSKATDAVLPSNLLRVIDVILKARSGEPAHEFLIDVQARITHLRLPAMQLPAVAKLEPLESVA